MDPSLYNQHAHQQGQLVAVDEMWKQRLQSIVEEGKTRELNMQTEIERLQERLAQLTQSKETEVTRIVAYLKSFTSQCQYNNHTSVPLILQKLEQLTNGLVDQATEIPAGSTNPAPIFEGENKRKRNENAPSHELLTTPATKRRMDQEDDLLIEEAPPSKMI
ncbi:hypothetical protein DIPPA_19892 [Diplonema papillatum]|nr:hypothetical protein DIPPA_19892 [Diplonema papillatum]